MSKKKIKQEEVENTQETTEQKEGKVEEPTPECNGQSDSEKEEKEADDEAQAKVEEEKDPMEKLQEELEESKNKYLRLSAEFDNYRKRTQREKMDLIRFGSEDVLKSVLPLIDDFERAIASTEKATDVEALKQGLSLIYGKFRDFLKSNNVQEIEAVGLELDTDVHEAITKIPVTEKKQKGKIVDVVEKGYKLNDKVIRYSKVVVGE